MSKKSENKIQVKMIKPRVRPSNKDEWLELVHAAQKRSDEVRKRCEDSRPKTLKAVVFG
ncbi:hypothetical protein [Methylophaga sp.]|uniref:hypothetical protein n=1 Tax=Methylophaga sp. TaxID=2024840 RepID=UPI003A8D031B